MDIIKLLKKNLVFMELGEDSLMKIADTFHRQIFDRGDVLIRQNTKISHIGLISSGVANLCIHDAGGHEIVSGQAGSQDFYGIVDHFVNGVFMTSLICQEPTRCYFQKTEDFQWMINYFPSVKIFFYQVALTSLWEICQTRTHFCLGTPLDSKNTEGIQQSGVSRNLEKAVSYIDENYMNPIDLEEISRKCHMSKYYFSRVFKSRLGISFKSYLNKTRIEAAKKMMAVPDMNVTEICFYVGFNDLSYFSRVFQKSEGVVPSIYRHGLLNIMTIKARQNFSGKGCLL